MLFQTSFFVYDDCLNSVRMKTRKSIFSLLLFLALLAGCTPESPSVSSEESFQGGTITFYAINDFHGAVKQSSSNKEPGILSLGTFLKGKGEEENTVLINSGDMFQGAIESNYNNGRLLVDCMNEIEFDCFTLGNHEFDWGLRILKENKLRRAETDGYQVPWLAANIYNYDNEAKAEGTIQQSDLGDFYTIKTLENGLKLGIIGMIGFNQWTSITSWYVDDVVFKDPAPLVKSLSDELRTQKGCDIVALDIHADQDDVIDTGITAVSPVSKEKYVDIVFCAHSHQKETTTKNGVLFTQNEAYGRNISQVTMTVDKDKNVTSSKLKTLDYFDVINSVGKNYDPNLKQLVDTYGAESSAAGNEVLGTMEGGYMDRYSNLPNMLAEAMLQEAEREGYSPALAMVNNCRKNIDQGPITYSDVYEAVPFDNEVWVINCDGADILKEAGYDTNLIARAENNAIVSGRTYQIAIIDYLAFHKSTKRVYDYFPSISLVGVLGAEGKDAHYRHILADYIREQGTIRYNDYSSSSWRHNKELLGQGRS